MTTRHCWAMALILACAPVAASDLFAPVEVSDAELAQLRGRYVLPDRIISFGVVMSSSWQNAAGHSIGAEVQMNIASGQLQPSLTVSMIKEAGMAQGVASGTGQVIGRAGLNSVQGIVQSVRAAGDFNKGTNDLNIRISHGAAMPVAPGGQAFTGSKAFSNAAGTVQVSAANGALQVALQAANGQGSSLQQIGGGGVAQQANIGGALNSVRNLATLNVALRSPASGISLINCLEQLRDLRQGGF